MKYITKIINLITDYDKKILNWKKLSWLQT
jgi:hypothetical protein